MAVFDYRNEMFSPPPCNQLVCAICHSVFYNPVELPCQHMFCEDCIQQWLHDRGTCPECRASTVASSLSRASRVVRNVILNLMIRCKNSSQGCQEICSVEHYEMHKNTCPYQLIKCPNGNCGLEILLKDKAKHEDTECVFYLTSCTVCKQLVIRHELLDHNCFGELKRELEITKGQLNRLQYDKNILVAQVQDLNRKQAEMCKEMAQALREIRNLRRQPLGVQSGMCETVLVLQNNMETVRNVVHTMKNLVKFSESQLSRVSVFLKGKRSHDLSYYRLPKSLLEELKLADVLYEPY